jgi:putative hydrolase of the HAD superfamily
MGTAMDATAGVDNDDTQRRTVTTLIFDVDDTLYDVSTGFTASRNGSAVYRFMVDHLNFPDEDAAKIVRDEYFERYHATAKALQVAEQEGRFPPPDPNKPHQLKSPRFDVNELSEYWATSLEYELLGGVKTDLLRDLADCKLKMIAFSNAPRKYVIRVLKELGLWGTVFSQDTVFAVDDVLPHCKPEKEAFETIFQKIGVTASECVMIEDSMKNIRSAKALGMSTVLVTGGQKSAHSAAAEATKPGDAPMKDDPAVDVAMATIEELRRHLPDLWQDPAHFSPPTQM